MPKKESRKEETNYDADYEYDNNNRGDVDEDWDQSFRPEKKENTNGNEAAIAKTEPSVAAKIDPGKKPEELANKVHKRRVVDFSSGEEDFIPSHQRLTRKGGYAHTKSSRMKISQANSGNVPWNKGKNRTDDARAKISAGVRARNHAILLKKLEKLGMAEEEYNASRRKLKLIRERVRRARLAVVKENEIRKARRLERRRKDEEDRRLRKKIFEQEMEEERKEAARKEYLEGSEDESSTDLGSDEELKAEEDIDEDNDEENDKSDDKNHENEEDANEKTEEEKNDGENLEETNDDTAKKCEGDEEEEEDRESLPSIFMRDVVWTPHPFDAKVISYKDLCSNGGPGGLICCEICTANYSKFLSKSYRNVEEHRIAKAGEEVAEIMKFTKAAKRRLALTVQEVRSVPVLKRRTTSNSSDESDDGNRNDRLAWTSAVDITSTLL